MSCILTYMLLSLFEFQGDNSRLQYWIGLLLLVSSGTFLHVSLVKILPEVYSFKDFDKSEGSNAIRDKIIEFLVLILGVQTPFLIQVFRGL